MNHLFMSVAPTSLTKALDGVGENSDGELKVWKNQLSCHLSREMETKKEVAILKQKGTERETIEGKDHVGVEKAALDQKVNELNTLYTKHPPNFAVVIDNFDSFRQNFSLCITKSGELEGCGDRFTLQASTVQEFCQPVP